MRQNFYKFPPSQLIGTGVNSTRNFSTILTCPDAIAHFALESPRFAAVSASLNPNVQINIVLAAAAAGGTHLQAKIIKRKMSHRVKA